MTNYRAPTETSNLAASRGNIVKDFLTGSRSPTDYLASIQSNGLRYNGFNLLAGDLNSLWYQPHPKGRHELVPPGFHGLSNARLNSPWPKVRTGIEALQQTLNLRLSNGSQDPVNKTQNEALAQHLDETKLLDILTDKAPAADTDLPNTGVGIDMERVLSSRFIHLPQGGYGTRVSTLLSFHKQGNVRFIERTWDLDATLNGTCEFEFQLQ